MTDLERELLHNLVTAAWPLPMQIVFGAGLLAVYWAWSRFYYAVIDPALRNVVGGVLGAKVVWVARYSDEFDTPLEFGFPYNRYHRWTWGIQAESRRTLGRDAAALLLSLLFVTLLGGLWPIAVFLFVFLQLKALSYVVFLPVCLAVLAIYSLFWAGRHEVAGMR
jgi:VIT1/CCC1 family predicted Fe2+/Mn2+ transporter